MQGSLEDFEPLLKSTTIHEGIGKSRPSADFLAAGIHFESISDHTEGFLRLLALSDQRTEGLEMAGPTREEMDAKFEASEARIDAKNARLEGKLDLVLARLDGIHTQMADVRNDGRSTRANIWAVCAVLAGVIIGTAALIVAIAPASFTLGTQVRDMVQKEVQTTGQVPPQTPRVQEPTQAPK